MTTPGPEAPRPRLEWIDAARAYAMFLVFYGHFVESLSRENDPALLQQTFVYAFHMPLFILISGMLAKTTLPPLKTFLHRQALTRLLPVVFFTALLLPLHVIDAMLPSRGGPTEIRGRYIDDWQALCARLATPGDEPGAAALAHLYGQLPPATQQQVTGAAAGDSLSPATREGIVATLNGLLDRPDLFPDSVFAGAPLPEAAQRQLQQDRAALAAEERLRHANWTLTWWTLQPESRYWGWQRSPWRRMWQDALMIWRGFPELNVPTWFLVGLFTVELLHFAVVRFLTSTLRIALAIPLFAVAGWFATAGMEPFTDIWFAREAVLLYAFYLLGLLLRHSGLLASGHGRAYALILFAAGTAVALATFNRNTGFEHFRPMVLINLSQHGHPLWFGLTAVAGCAAVLGLARLLPAPRWLTYMGRHTLLLMGLNGFFYHFGNDWIRDLLEIPAATGPVLLWSTLASVGTMAVCVPVMQLLERCVPQLVGRPQADGPLLPALWQERK